MKTFYYLMHWGPSVVDGFLVPNVETPEEGLKKLKKHLVLTKLVLQQKRDNCNGTYYGADVERCKQQLRILRRPWRYFNRGDIFSDGRIRLEPYLTWQELDMPVVAGYWLTEMVTQEHLCNLDKGVTFSKGNNVKT